MEGKEEEEEAAFARNRSTSSVDADQFVGLGPGFPANVSRPLSTQPPRRGGDGCGLWCGCSRYTVGAVVWFHSEAHLAKCPVVAGEEEGGRVGRRRRKRKA